MDTFSDSLLSDAGPKNPPDPGPAAPAAGASREGRDRLPPHARPASSQGADDTPSGGAAAVASRRAAPSSPRDADADVDAGGPSREGDEEGSQELAAELVRSVVRLLQCPICSFPLRHPVTLPCGRTLCRRCLPASHARAHISYPSDPARLRGFDCPFPDCGREHADGDCALDVVLDKATSAAIAELDKGRDAALGADLSTRLAIANEWAIAGVPSLQDHQDHHAPRTLPGGRLLATYLLARSGDLDYHADVVFFAASAGPAPSAAAAAAAAAALDASLLARVQSAVRAELDCQVCYALFYDAVTTPCGHTFCRACLQRVLDYTSCCPVCRGPLSMRQPAHDRAAAPANERLARITSALWPDLLAARRSAVAREGLPGGGDDDLDTAVFLCTLSFPAMPTFLHVFEPRYRLMIRRALEGDRTFGMVMARGESGFVDVGTLLRIVHVQYFPDGRSLIETVGLQRFRILRHGVRDGYMVARIERIHDISTEEEERIEARETGSAAAAAAASRLPDRNPDNEVASSPLLLETRFPTSPRDVDVLPTQALMHFARDFVRRMRERSVRWLTARILVVYGECPTDPALFPWWFANILPVRESEKYRLLETTSVRERLKICCCWILEWEARQW